jgi:hypothetical protein
MSAYTNIPGQIVEDLREGKITNKMFNVLFWLYSRANFKTGLVRMASSKRVLNEMWVDENEDDRPSLRTIQEILYKLRMCGYITSLRTPHAKGSYVVMIHNYPAQKKDEDGALIDVVLNPKETTDWHDLPKTRCAEEIDSECAEASADVAQTLRRECAEASAYTSLSPDAPDSSLSTLSGFKEGRKEGRKEDAQASPSLSVFNPSESIQESYAEFMRKNPNAESEIKAIAIQWYERTGLLFMGIEDEMRAGDLLAEYGYEVVYQALELIFRCPKTAGIPWKDFTFFYEHFDQTLRNAQAWQRKLVAVEEIKQGHIPDAINGPSEPTTNRFEIEEGAI